MADVASHDLHGLAHDDLDRCPILWAPPGPEGEHPGQLLELLDLGDQHLAEVRFQGDLHWHVGLRARLGVHHHSPEPCSQPLVHEEEVQL
eukprot:3210400-Alexandrium_andersonii.AAC.1